MNFQADANEHYRNEFIKKIDCDMQRSTLIFYKQPVFKQLALGWQIA